MMKKFKFITFLASAFVAVLSFTSCSSDGKFDVAEFDGENQNLQQSCLLKSLTIYNDSVLATYPTTRGNGKLIDVVVEDIYGAYKGGRKGWNFGKKFLDKRFRVATTLLFGAIYGGYKSWNAAPTYKPNDRDIVIGGITPADKRPLPLDSIKPFVSMAFVGNVNEVNTNHLIVGDSITLKGLDIDNAILSSIHLTTEQLNIGKLHNVVLAAMDGKIKTDKPYMINSTDSVIMSILESTELENLYKAMGTTHENEYFKDVLETLPDRVMEMFDDVFANSPDNVKCIVNLINDYADMIDKSEELTEEQKNSIKNGLATAIYSLNYWNNKK